jgi:hypothetical protein
LTGEGFVLWIAFSCLQKSAVSDKGRHITFSLKLVSVGQQTSLFGSKTQSFQNEKDAECPGNSAVWKGMTGF